MEIQKTMLVLFITLFYFTSSFNLFSTIIEIDNINELIPFIIAAQDENDTLMLFDIDGTLIDSPISLNSEPWISYYWQNAPKLLPKKMPIIEELMWYVSKSIPCLSVDPFTASLISLYQNQPLMIPLAFTARPIYKKSIDGIKVTNNQLLDVKIDFSQTISPLHLVKHPSFHGGIIFTSGKMKGDFLQQFLISTEYLPSRIIFIDDKLEQLQSVAKSMQKIGINVMCFWFRRASLNRSSFNLQLANIQLEYLLKHQLILNDEEAGLLMMTEEYTSKASDEFLKQLIELYEQLSPLL